MKAVRLLICVIGLILGGAVFGFGKDIYVAQSAAGANSGSDCGDAHPATWFNSAGSWGSNSSQISPGDTVHLCGLFSSALNALASGTSSATTTILFESGAKISLPYCPASGCVGLASLNYITVDGGSNGIIESTANGSAQANKQTSFGVYGDTPTNIEVKNLIIRNMYIHTGGSDEESTGADNSGGVFFKYSGSNIKVHDNTISEGHTGVGIWANSSGTFGNWEVYNNTLSEEVWGVDLTGGYTAGQLDSASVHDNTIFDNDHWWGPANNFHTDPIFVRAPGTGRYQNIYIYNNHIYGALGHMTGYIFLSQYSNGPSYVFNNVMAATSTSPDVPCAGEGAVAMEWNGTNNYYIYNNTVDGRGICGISANERSTNSSNVTHLEWKNNINLDTMGHWVQTGTFTSDNNVWYLIANAGGQAFKVGNSYYTWTAWQSAANDANSIVSDPKLNSDYTLQSASPAIGLGQNLTSICQGQPVPGLGALCKDKNGSSRPSTGGWDAGAIQFSQGGAPPPPTSLATVVH